MKNKISASLLFLTIILFCMPTITKADYHFKNNEKVVIEDLSKYFNGYNGCFIMLNKNRREYTIYNKDKCQVRISPHSTFKMYLTLIGLETGVIKDENTKIKWNGIRYPIDAWNSDQTLSSAIANSVNWYYESVSKKIGKQRINKFVKDISYGNKDMSGKGYPGEQCLPTSLKISPMEQIQLLEQMYSYKLPVKKRNVDILKKIIVLSKEDAVTLSGKTGTEQGKLGWFVGYVEKSDNVYFFATNIQGGVNASGAAAKEISLRILKDKKVFPIK